MKALDRSVEMLGLWIVTSSVTFIKSVNQSSIKPCLIVHPVALLNLIYFSLALIATQNTNGVASREMAQCNVEWYRSVHAYGVALREMAHQNIELHSIQTNSVALREMAQRNVK